MIPKSMSSTEIGDANRFSDKIMLKQKAGAPRRAGQPGSKRLGYASGG
jgi:hypothetical protein